MVPDACWFFRTVARAALICARSSIGQKAPHAQRRILNRHRYRQAISRRRLFPGCQAVAGRQRTNWHRQDPFPFFTPGASEESSWRRSALMGERSLVRSWRLAFKFSSSIHAASRHFVMPKVCRQDRLAERRPHRALCSQDEPRPSPNRRHRSADLEGLVDLPQTIDRTSRHGEGWLRQVMDQMIIDSCRDLTTTLEKACGAIEEELTQRISVDACLACNREILVSIPGICQHISTVVITDMPDLAACWI
jgi:hypothetical protein